MRLTSYLACVWHFQEIRFDWKPSSPTFEWWLSFRHRLYKIPQENQCIQEWETSKTSMTSVRNDDEVHRHSRWRWLKRQEREKKKKRPINLHLLFGQRLLILDFQKILFLCLMHEFSHTCNWSVPRIMFVMSHEMGSSRVSRKKRRLTFSLSRLPINVIPWTWSMTVSPAIQSQSTSSWVSWWPLLAINAYLVYAWHSRENQSWTWLESDQVL